MQEVFGGNAVSDEYHIGRHVANLFVTQTYEGQSDIHGKFGQGNLIRHDVLKSEQLLFSAVQLLAFKLSVRCAYPMNGQALDSVDRLTDALILCKIAKKKRAHKTNKVQDTQPNRDRSICLKMERVMSCSMIGVDWR